MFIELILVAFNRKWERRCLKLHIAPKLLTDFELEINNS